MLQLRGQIMAYRMLARNQSLSQQVALAVQGKVPSGKIKTKNECLTKDLKKKKNLE